MIGATTTEVFNVSSSGTTTIGSDSISKYEFD